MEPANPAPPPEPLKLGPLTQERLEAGRVWLAEAAGDRWFIQMLATDAGRHGEVEALLRRLASSKAEMNSVHVYFSELSGSPRYGVIYGNYSTRKAAAQAIRGLPPALQKNKPYPRQVVRLR